MLVCCNGLIRSRNVSGSRYKWARRNIGLVKGRGKKENVHLGLSCGKIPFKVSLTIMCTNFRMLCTKWACESRLVVLFVYTADIILQVMRI